jgi:hypothetical protein
MPRWPPFYLVAAAKEANVDDVRSLLQDGMDPNLEHWSATPVSFAMFPHQRWLVDHRGDGVLRPFKWDPGKLFDCPLTQAQVDTVLALAEGGARLDVEDSTANEFGEPLNTYNARYLCTQCRAKLLSAENFERLKLAFPGKLVH